MRLLGYEVYIFLLSLLKTPMVYSRIAHSAHKNKCTEYASITLIDDSGLRIASIRISDFLKCSCDWTNICCDLNVLLFTHYVFHAMSYAISRMLYVV
jgi:hypothetical protein